MTELLLWGAPGAWPFRGAFRGAVSGLSWAGRIGQTAPLDVAFRMSRAVDDALRQTASADRRRRVARAWEALNGLDLLTYRGDLCLLLVGHDEEGHSVSGVGLQALWASDGETPPTPWVPAGHPLLGARGLADERPGALAVAVLPALLVAVAADDPTPTLPSTSASLRQGSGVWP